MLLNEGPLSGLLHGSDYFPGHPWSSSAWLDVMDGEEMVMSETVPSPARSQPLNNYSCIVWLSRNKSGDSLKMGSLTRLWLWSIHLDLVENNSMAFMRTFYCQGLDLSQRSFISSIPSFIRKAPLDPTVSLLEYQSTVHQNTRTQGQIFWTLKVTILHSTINNKYILQKPIELKNNKKVTDILCVIALLKKRIERFHRSYT